MNFTLAASMQFLHDCVSTVCCELVKEEMLFQRRRARFYLGLLVGLSVNRIAVSVFSGNFLKRYELQDRKQLII